MSSYTYLIESLSSQSTIRNKRISEDMSFTTVKQSFQNLWSKIMEITTLLLLSFEYLRVCKELASHQNLQIMFVIMKALQCNECSSKASCTKFEDLCPYFSFS